ncbi:LolA family protein [Falsibacillus albus]|uniref:Outer membrane lipoprotein carrier protein LolA n=1 Tax=Falsibacillus albus TaxID=2478915 RepID=A0A3L7JSD0_9BACI|nr:outer membrane lipoprotein carrier protein LolA [Falsibacillus albus]RLQ93175.1 outer membrane lipoprotein carrier protein LolA [Falsibacillus albus]
MKRTFLVLIVAISAILALSACGTKTQEDVIKDLNQKLGDLKGYKAHAKMTLQMGNEPQTYNIDVWHNQPDYYRVNLKNAQRDQSQMILRNKDGVYVLTPALNKSFKFQSDWPENSSQAYLYESLVKDIIQDKNAKFSVKDNYYVFETKTRYQNSKMLPTQEIKLNKRNLAPVSVKVMDTDHNPLVTVEFSKVEFNASFDKDAFDTNKNMTGAQLEVPVDASVNGKEFKVQYPTADIGNVSLIEQKDIDTGTGKRIVLTYGGDKSFTLVEEKAKVVSTAMVSTEASGKIVDLGFTIGAMTDASVRWTYNGVDYMLASKDLSADEMMKVARSVQGNMVK